MKTVKILTAILLCLALLCSCTGDSSRVVISGADTSSADITANMYNLWASTSKANFMYTYSDIEDTEQFWQSEYSDGKTYADYLDALVLEDVKITAVCLMLYNEYRLSLSDSVKQAIEAEINDYITEYAEGNRNTLNNALSLYGANIEILRSVKLANEKRTLVYSHLFGEGGEMALTDADLEAYYKVNFNHFQIIYINNKFEYVQDKDGNYTTNTDGTYVTRALTGEALEKKNALIKAVNDGIAEGKDFQSLYEEYSEVKSYDNGYYFSANGSYTDAVFYTLIGDMASVPVGECTTVEYDSGTYIIKRLPLEDGAWTDSRNKDFFESFEAQATNAAFRQFISGYFEKLTVDKTIISDYSVAKVIANNRF